MQSYTLTRRSFLNMSRDMGYYWLRLAMYIGLSVCIGTIYYKVGYSYTSIMVSSRSYCKFIGSVFLDWAAVLIYIDQQCLPVDGIFWRDWVSWHAVCWYMTHPTMRCGAGESSLHILCCWISNIHVYWGISLLCGGHEGNHDTYVECWIRVCMPKLIITRLNILTQPVVDR